MEFDVVYFYPESDSVEVEELSEFIKDADIVITEGSAYSIESIKGVEDSLRGAIIRFNDDLYEQGYRVTSKLVKTKLQ